jgi:hypothetical protein
MKEGIKVCKSFVAAKLQSCSQQSFNQAVGRFHSAERLWRLESSDCMTVDCMTDLVDNKFLCYFLKPTLQRHVVNAFAQMREI